MDRRGKSISGCVNFPVDNEYWENSREGGLFVKLVVCDNREFNQQFGVCCGVHVYDHLSEVLIGDDRRPKPQFDPDKHKEPSDFGTLWDENMKWEDYHYPNARIIDNRVSDREQSRPYLASIVLGSTGWSGYNDMSSNTYWYCTYDDLNEQGKRIYDSLKELYVGCDLHLLTFLDT